MAAGKATGGKSKVLHNVWWVSEAMSIAFGVPPQRPRRIMISEPELWTTNRILGERIMVLAFCCLQVRYA